MGWIGLGHEKFTHVQLCVVFSSDQLNERLLFI